MNSQTVKRILRQFEEGYTVREVVDSNQFPFAPEPIIQALYDRWRQSRDRHRS